MWCITTDSPGTLEDHPVQPFLEKETIEHALESHLENLWGCGLYHSPAEALPVSDGSHGELFTSFVEVKPLSVQFVLSLWLLGKRVPSILFVAALFSPGILW